MNGFQASGTHVRATKSQCLPDHNMPQSTVVCIQHYHHPLESNVQIFSPVLLHLENFISHELMLAIARIRYIRQQ